MNRPSNPSLEQLPLESLLQRIKADLFTALDLTDRDGLTAVGARLMLASIKINEAIAAHNATGPRHKRGR